jgi:hypothetical protein
MFLEGRGRCWGALFGNESLISLFYATLEISFFFFYVVRFDCCRGVFSSPSASLSGSSLHDWLTFIPLDSASVHWLNYLSLSLLAGGGNNKKRRKIFSFSLRVGGRIGGQYNMEQTDISLFLDSIEKDKRK